MSALDLEQVGAGPLSLRETARAYYELTKPNLSLLVVITGVLGYVLRTSVIDPWVLLHLMVGLFATSGGAGALNMWIERESDAKMRRTAVRPIPSGRLRAGHALAFAVGLFVLGFAELMLFVHPVSALLALTTMVLYAAIYTPLKRKGSIAIAIGAVPGAIPPVIGWAAVDGTIGAPAWALFALLFAWQYPHFLALAWMYREDYARAGFDFLPGGERAGKRAALQMIVGASLLLPATLALAALGTAHALYAGGAQLLGVWFASRTARMWWAPGAPAARATFFASIIYLPLLLALLVVDRWIYGA